MLFDASEPRRLRKRVKDLEPGDVVAIPAGDAKRLGAPYAEVLQAPRTYAGYATPFLGVVGMVAVEIRAVGGNGERMSCIWCAGARVTLLG